MLQRRDLLQLDGLALPPETPELAYDTLDKESTHPRTALLLDRMPAWTCVQLLLCTTFASANVAVSANMTRHPNLSMSCNDGDGERSGRFLSF